VLYKIKLRVINQIKYYGARFIVLYIAIM